MHVFHRVPRLFIFKKRNVTDKSSRENQNACFIFNKVFRKSCRLRENVEKYRRARQTTDKNVIQRMRFVCWITKATETHSKYVILIALPQQQWLRERASILRYTYISCVPNLNTFQTSLLSHPCCLTTPITAVFSLPK